DINLLLKAQRSVIIDLNDKHVGYEINVRNSAGVEADITIKNGMIGLLDKSALYYGVMVNGNAGLEVTLDNVVSYGYYGGLYTNGTFEGVILNVVNSIISSGIGKGMGAYLAANYTYNFENTVFEGSSAIHIKSGE